MFLTVLGEAQTNYPPIRRRIQSGTGPNRPPTRTAG